MISDRRNLQQFVARKVEDVDPTFMYVIIVGVCWPTGYNGLRR